MHDELNLARRMYKNSPVLRNSFRCYDNLENRPSGELAKTQNF